MITPPIAWGESSHNARYCMYVYVCMYVFEQYSLQERWVKSVRIPNTVFFESIIYREIFPKLRTEWETLDFVITGIQIRRYYTYIHTYIHTYLYIYCCGPNLPRYVQDSSQAVTLQRLHTEPGTNKVFS